MEAEPLVNVIRQQALACDRLGSPLYGDLLQRMADDLAAGGPSAAVLDGFEHLGTDAAPALRLAGTAHRLALTGQAPNLASHYPSCGGDGDPKAAWPAFRDVLVEHLAELRAGMTLAPQTNEVGRAAALLGGLLTVSARHPLPVRLFEIGCSGGLNLRADRFAYRTLDGDSWALGPSPVTLDPAWDVLPPGAPAELDVVERVGADPAPVDATSADGAARLASYVWPDQLERMARLRAALDVARGVPVRLLRCTAAELADSLRLADGALTVLWHSVMWQYLDAAEQQRVLGRLDQLGASATERNPLAHVAFEPSVVGESLQFTVRATTWPGGEQQVLGQAPPHGVMVEWFR